MENIIQITEEIDCEISTAFNYFTTNKLIESWLTEKADVEPQIGGKYELFWDHEDRENNSTIGCKITGIENEKYISFDWKGPIQFKPFMNTADPLTHVIVFFSSNNPDKTTIHLFHTGWRSDSEWQNAREYFERAWSNALNELKKTVANKTMP
ncbi:MAG: SRPBCC family protein [Promethearchaeota archaeon]